MTDTEAASRRTSTIARSLFVIYTAAILAVTMWPKPVTEGSNKDIIDSVLTASHDAGVPVSFDFHSLQFVANIVMFVPFGFLLVLSLASRRVWRAALGAFALTSTIELVQQFLLLERSGDVWDVVANTAGGVMGATFAVAWQRWRGAPTRAMS